MANLLRFLLLFGLVVGWSNVLINPPNVAAQNKPWNSEFGDLLNTDSQNDDGPVFTIAGDFSVEQGTQNGTLNLTLDIQKGWHAYPQEPVPGQTPTELQIKSSEQFKQVGPFTPNKKPKKRMNESGALAVEFVDQVIWSAPIEFAQGVDPASVQIQVGVAGQVCKMVCMPLNDCLLYTSPSPRDATLSRMPSSA